MKSSAIIIARLIFAGVFFMAAGFKFAGMEMTATEITNAGFLLALPLAWIAAFFEVALAIGFLTGLYFREVALISIVYVLFLAFSFHGPNRWAANPMEFGFFIDHFTFTAGLLFAAVHGPGTRMVLKRTA
jgi:putative oxidoreductase